MIFSKKAARTSIAACMTVASVSMAEAAEGFQVRYNLAGSLGGEMFAPPDQSGLAMGIAATRIRISKVTGDDGAPLTSTIPGGTVPLPAPAPAVLYPTYGASTARLHAEGGMTQWNLGIGYMTTDRYQGGRFAFGINVPYARRTQTINSEAATPALNWNPAAPAPVQAAVGAQFNSQYQGALAAQGASESGEISGFGDTEVLAGWQYVGEKMLFLAGGSLVLPTGKYNAGPGPDIGYGNFYTFRPAAQVAYLPTPDLAFAAKLSLGLNTRNRDNDLRSGNWFGVELATGYKTPIGVIGLHGIHVQQYQDDSNNPVGASRFRSTNMGAFFTTKVPGTDAALTVQYMATTVSRNAQHGDFIQARIIHVF